MSLVEWKNQQCDSGQRGMRLKQALVGGSSQFELWNVVDVFAADRSWGILQGGGWMWCTVIPWG